MTEFLLRATQKSLSRAVPVCVTLWKSTCGGVLMVEMWITVGLSKGSSRVRRAQPSWKATLAFQQGSVQSRSCLEISSIERGASAIALKPGMAMSSVAILGIFLLTSAGSWDWGDRGSMGFIAIAMVVHVCSALL